MNFCIDCEHMIKTGSHWSSNRCGAPDQELEPEPNPVTGETWYRIEIDNEVGFIESRHPTCLQVNGNGDCLSFSALLPAWFSKAMGARAR